MKYLYLIIRHFFPKRIWKEVRVLDLYDQDSRMNTGKIFIYEDQFGNRKHKRIP